MPAARRQAGEARLLGQRRLRRAADACSTTCPGRTRTGAARRVPAGLHCKSQLTTHRTRSRRRSPSPSPCCGAGRPRGCGAADATAGPRRPRRRRLLARPTSARSRPRVAPSTSPTTSARASCSSTSGRRPATRAWPRCRTSSTSTRQKDKGFVVLAISLDGPESLADVNRVVHDKGMVFPVLLDQETTVVARYNPKREMPFSVLIDKDAAPSSRSARATRPATRRRSPPRWRRRSSSGAGC